MHWWGIVTSFHNFAGIFSGSGFYNVTLWFIPDTNWQSVGPGVPQHASPGLTDVSTTACFYLMPESEFHEDGILIALEAYAIRTGDVDLLVSRAIVDLVLQVLLDSVLLVTQKLWIIIKMKQSYIILAIDTQNYHVNQNGNEFYMLLLSKALYTSISNKLNELNLIVDDFAILWWMLHAGMKYITNMCIAVI